MLLRDQNEIYSERDRPKCDQGRVARSTSHWAHFLYGQVEQ